MKNTDYHIDMNNKLTITITNKVPVSLVDLTNSLTGLADQYYSYIANDSQGRSKGKLYVSEIRKGSMIFEIIAETLPYIPLLVEAGTIPLESWITQFIATTKWLKGIGKKPDLNLEKQDYKNIHKAFSTVANDNSSAITFNLDGANIKNFSPVIYTSDDAKKIMEGAKNEMDLLDEKNEHTYKNRLMIWDQTKFNLKANTGDKALIECIYEKPVKIIFQNESDKEYMYNAGKDFDGTPWQELGFIVDVEVQYVNGTPKVYNIIHTHKNETFILDDE